MDDTLKALIVDDDPDILFATSRVAKQEGLTVFEAGSGNKCLELFEKHRPHIIVLDVMLQDMSGIDVCRTIKSKYPDSAPLIILMSGKKTDENSKTSGLDCGADGYLTRPIGNRVLKAYLGAFIRIKRGEIQIKEENDAKEILNKKLEQSNRDYSHFASVISHDLKEPLRMVTSYMQLLEKRNEDLLDEKSKKYLNYAVDGAKRMNAMISGLLNVSRIATQSHAIESLDMQELLKSVLQNLTHAIQDSDAKIVVEQLPVIEADRTQMIHLFQNLISNAIKFNDKPHAEVRISANPDGHAWQFNVADNGIGIPEEQQQHIFGIFKRLHTRDEYPGTGVGLAAVKRIIERHGGSISVTSKPGHGTTFSFTLTDRELEDPGQT